MSLSGDYAHLRRLADEMPFDLLEELVGQIRHAADEARLVLGHGHPKLERVEGAFQETENECSNVAAALGNVVTVLRDVAGPQ